MRVGSVNENGDPPTRGRSGEARESGLRSAFALRATDGTGKRGRRLKAEGRRLKAEGRRLKAEGRRLKAEG
jgi:hypothetical protein